MGEPYRDMVVATWKPTDPDVLARLTFQPLPAYLPPIAGMQMASGPRMRSGPILIGQNMVYRSFVQPVSAYQSFRPASLVYGDFSRKALRVRGAPLDLRVAGGGIARGLVTPKAFIDRTTNKVAKRPREDG